MTNSKRKKKMKKKKKEEKQKRAAAADKDKLHVTPTNQSCKRISKLVNLIPEKKSPLRESNQAPIFPHFLFFGG